MASLPDPEDSIFEKLRTPLDPKVLENQTKAAHERDRAQYETTQRRLSELVESNSTLPCTISAIRVINAPNTRRAFLSRIFDPILSANQDRPYTFMEAIKHVSEGVEKLHKFDIFHQPVSTYIKKPSPTDPSSTPTDIEFMITAKEKSRFALKTGTEVGNAEGNAYGNFLWRNVLGGAESLNVNAALGTRTRSAYQATFDTPVLSNPDLRVQLGGLASATDKSWASHEEVLKGGWMKLLWARGQGHTHEFEYNSTWRQITGLASTASPTIRSAAGDSVKSSISHTWTSEQRDYPMLPNRGYLLKTISEIAGWGPLQGDVAFWKSEIQTQTTLPIPLPFLKTASGITFTTGLRAGLLYPLGLGTDATPKPSHLSDRFQLGGPTDVRGFRLSGLGPHDGNDAVGSDIYAAGSASLLFPLPKVSLSTPLRLQLFVNGGRSLALQGSSAQKNGTLDAKTVQKNVYSTLAELGNGIPSVAAGIGLVYAHPVARFELNFSMPLVRRQGEGSRKGLQVGIGMNFL